MLSLTDCTVGYGKGPIFENLSMEVAEGELLVIVGTSGCGKSTLLNLIGGLLPPHRGSLLLEGSRIRGGDPRIGMVQQHYGLFPWMTAAENIELALRLQGVRRSERRGLAAEALHNVGLGDKGAHYPGKLSGGEQQRLALARTHARKPALLLLDEPFSALDAFTREELQEELLEMRKVRRPTAVMVTHSLEEAVYLADRIGVMYGTPAALETFSNPWPLPSTQRAHLHREQQGYLAAVAALRHRFEELHRG